MDSEFLDLKDPQKWLRTSNTSDFCDLCSSKKTGLFFQDSGLNVCLSCVLKEVEDQAEIQSRSQYQRECVESAFFLDQDPSLKIGLIMDLDRLIFLITSISDYEKRERFTREIILNLGSTYPHPLTPLLRLILQNQLMSHFNIFYAAIISIANHIPDCSEYLDVQQLRYHLAIIMGHCVPRQSISQKIIVQVLEESTSKDGVEGDFYVNNNLYYPVEKINSFPKRLVQLINDFSNSDDGIEEVPIKDQMLGILSHVYTRNNLNDIIRLMTPDFRNRVKECLGCVFPEPKTLKKRVCSFITEIFLHPELSQEYIDQLPSWVKNIFNEVLWQDKTISLSDLAIKAGQGLTERDSSYLSSGSLAPEASLFQFKSNLNYFYETREGTFYLGRSISSLYRYCLRDSLYCRLQAKDSPDKGFRIIRNQNILQQLEPLSIYLRQVGIKFSKNGKNILKSSLREVNKLCCIDEPYPDEKNLEFLRTDMLIRLMNLGINKGINPEQDSEEFLKNLFLKFFSPEEEDLDNFSQFLTYLRYYNWYREENSQEEVFRVEKEGIKALLSNMTRGSWYTIDNIYRYLNSLNLLPSPFDSTILNNQLTFTQKKKDSYGSYNETEYVTDDNRGATIFMPYLKVLMFILNTLGLVDLSCDVPRNEEYTDKNHPWLSVYDGIKGLSLTDLGSWLIGGNEDYKPSLAASSAEVILDDKRLFISLNGRDGVKEMTLGRMAKELVSNCFQVTSETFLQDCKDEADIRAKIELFRKSLSKNPPPIWEDFFTSLFKKVHPFEQKLGKMLLFSLNPDDEELLKILTQNPKLSSKILKVENYQILIAEKDYSFIQKKMAAFGYLLPNKLQLG